MVEFSKYTPIQKLLSLLSTIDRVTPTKHSFSLKKLYFIIEVNFLLLKRTFRVIQSHQNMYPILFYNFDNGDISSPISVFEKNIINFSNSLCIYIKIKSWFIQESLITMLPNEDSKRAGWTTTIRYKCWVSLQGRRSMIFEAYGGGSGIRDRHSRDGFFPSFLCASRILFSYDDTGLTRVYTSAAEPVIRRLRVSEYLRRGRHDTMSLMVSLCRQRWRRGIALVRIVVDNGVRARAPEASFTVVTVKVKSF